MTVNLKRVRLELARTAEYPEGSSEHGYEFIAPIDISGQIESNDWKKFKNFCRVTRFAGWEPRLEHCVMSAEVGVSIMTAGVRMATSRSSN